MNKNKLVLCSLVLVGSAYAMDDNRLDYHRLMQMGKNGTPQEFSAAIRQSGKTPAAIVGDALYARKQEAIQQLQGRFETESTWTQVNPVDWNKARMGQKVDSVIAQYAKPGEPVSYQYCDERFDPTAQNAINTAIKEAVADNNALPVQMVVPRRGYPCPTAQAMGSPEGNIIVFNPDALRSYTENELRFIFAHELGHLWLQHDQYKMQFVPTAFSKDERGTVEQKQATITRIGKSPEFNRLSRTIELEADSCAVLCHDNADVQAVRDTFWEKLFKCFGPKTSPTHPSFEKRQQWAMAIKGLKEAQQKNK